MGLVLSVRGSLQNWAMPYPISGFRKPSIVFPSLAVQMYAYSSA